MIPVEILKVSRKEPLFKGEEPANAIELISLEGKGFQVVAQKNLYEVDDDVVYIQPDHSLSDIKLFESYIRPNGDASKSRLGSNFRIKAVKFNLHTGDGLPVYSQGICLPWLEVLQYLQQADLKAAKTKSVYSLKQLMMMDLAEALNITKWEAPDDNKNSMKGGASRDFPENLYRTDETNINNIFAYLDKQLPAQLIGSKKVDGSSITIYKTDKAAGICSRNFEKPLKIRKVIGRRSKNLLDYLMFWKKADLNVYEYVDSDSDFVKVGKQYLDILIASGITNVALRGELCGEGLKGSGNKNNPDNKGVPRVVFYGIDYYNGNMCYKLAADDFYRTLVMLSTIDKNVSFDPCNIIFHREFINKEEVINLCNAYFKHNMIEGIVVRSLDSKLSMKVMNPEYDAKK